MNRTRQSNRTAAFTLVELLVVMAIIGILASMILPGLSQGTMRAKRIRCVSNLQQVGLAFHSFSHDHDGKFPMQVSTNDGGSLELVTASYAATGDSSFASRIFRSLVYEPGTPGVLVCPTDMRLPATTFPLLENDNLSYFIGAKAEYGKPNSIVAGDRNVTNNTPGGGSVLRLDANNIVRWTGELHRYRGDVLFADGHVEQLNRSALMVGNDELVAATVLIVPSSQTPPGQPPYAYNPTYNPTYDPGPGPASYNPGPDPAPFIPAPSPGPRYNPPPAPNPIYNRAPSPARNANPGIADTRTGVAMPSRPATIYPASPTFNNYADRRPGYQPAPAAPAARPNLTNPPAKPKAVVTRTNIIIPLTNAPAGADLAMGTFDQKFVAVTLKTFKWIYLLVLLLVLALVAYEMWRRAEKRKARRQRAIKKYL